MTVSINLSTQSKNQMNLRSNEKKPIENIFINTGDILMLIETFFENQESFIKNITQF